MPRLVRAYWLVPLTVALVVFLGATLTLPPGPLCDEGMVLFMEGGCDYGLSNIFFFSKLGLLIALNAAFVLYCRNPAGSYRAFLPHFLVAAYLVYRFFSEEACETYYSHPNGSLGQMVAELACFAALGLVVVRTSRPRRGWMIAALIVSWNLAHVGAFYAWLDAYDHWLWRHTLALGASLLVVAMVLETYRRSSRRGRSEFATKPSGPA